MRFDEVIQTYGYPVISKEVAGDVYGAKHGVAKNGDKTIRMKRLCGEVIAPDGKKSRFNKEKWRFLLNAPFEISDKCCTVMKKNPSNEYGRLTRRKGFTGMMAAESRIRKTTWIKYGCNAFEANVPKSNPLSF